MKTFPEMTEPQKEAHRAYIRALRAMGPEQRLLRAFELSDFARMLFMHGLRKANPNLSEEEFHELYLKRIALCHNRNW